MTIEPAAILPTWTRGLKSRSLKSGQPLKTFILVEHIRHWILYLCGEELDFPGGNSGKESACQCSKHKRLGFHLWVGKIPWSKKWQSTPAFLPGKFHGQRSLVGLQSMGSQRYDWVTELNLCFQNIELHIPSHATIVTPHSLTPLFGKRFGCSLHKTHPYTRTMTRKKETSVYL